MTHPIRLLAVLLLGLAVQAPLAPAANPIDLSLLVAEDHPCTWPSGFPMFQLKHYRRIGALTPYNIDVLTIDGNTGTQIDVPPHSIPRPGSGLANEGPLGTIFTEKVAASIVTLPLYPHMTDAEVETIADVVNDCARSLASSQASVGGSP